METRNWWRSAMVALCLAGVSCADNTTDPHESAGPQFSRNAAHGPASQLDFTVVARFTRAQVGAEVHHARIGPEGGSLRVGDFEVVVPVGAVDRATVFEIKIPAQPREGDPVYAEFSPHQQFNVPVTIRLPHDGTDASDTPVIGWWSGEKWVALPTSATEDRRLETQVGHFSYYATCRKGVIVGGG